MLLLDFNNLVCAGELALVVALVLSILYLLAFSHGQSKFSRPLGGKTQGWSQPREDVPNWIQQHALYATSATEDVSFFDPYLLQHSQLRPAERSIMLEAAVRGFSTGDFRLCQASKSE